MKAAESVKNYPSTLRMYTNYTVREIRKVCREFGPRASGSEAESAVQAHFEQELKSCSTTTALEKFSVHPHAFMGWLVIDGIALILAIVFSLLNLPIVSLVLALISIVLLVGEFVMYKELLDPLFPKKTSCNAIGTRKPTGEVKQRIVFSGHTDSAFEWTYNHLGGKPMLFGVMIYAIVGMIFVFAVSIAAVAKFGAAGTQAQGAIRVLEYVQIAFAPGFVAVMFFTNFKLPVMGANDNLTGAVASIAVLKYLEDNNITFENTEVVAATVGCEEAGLRGARAYVKSHLDELKSVPTVFFCMDTLRDYDNMAIYSRDMSGTVKNDPRVCALIKKGAQLAGVDLPYSSVYLGASDAAAVSKLGVPAATLAAMNPDPPRYYHTRGDVEQELVPKTVEKCLDICLQSLFLFDEQGLKESYDD